MLANPCLEVPALRGQFFDRDRQLAQGIPDRWSEHPCTRPIPTAGSLIPKTGDAHPQELSVLQLRFRLHPRSYWARRIALGRAIAAGRGNVARSPRQVSASAMTMGVGSV